MYVAVEMDKARNFKYGMRAMSIIEKKLGKPAGKINFEELMMEDLAVIIMAGLKHEDEKLTPEKVMDIIDDKGNFDEVIQSMQEAFVSAFGTADEGKNE